MDRYPPLVRYLLRLIMGFVIITALILTKHLLVPLFWSILFAYLLYPAAVKLENWRIPRIISNLILILGSAIFFLALIYGIIQLVSTFLDNLPSLKENVEQNITQFRWSLGRTFGVTAQELDNLTQQSPPLFNFWAAF